MDELKKELDSLYNLLMYYECAELDYDAAASDETRKKIKQLENQIAEYSKSL